MVVVADSVVGEDKEEEVKLWQIVWWGRRLKIMLMVVVADSCGDSSGCTRNCSGGGGRWRSPDRVAIISIIVSFPINSSNGI